MANVLGTSAAAFLSALAASPCTLRLCNLKLLKQTPTSHSSSLSLPSPCLLSRHQPEFHGEQIRVVESVRYLCLIISSFMSWKQYTTAATNLTSMYPTFHGVQTGIFCRVYGALVLSKLDYGSQFHSSVNERLLTGFNP